MQAVPLGPAAPDPFDRPPGGPLQGGQRSWRRLLLVVLVTVALLVQILLRPLTPGSDDPLRLLGGGDGPVAAQLQGRLLEDSQGASPCRVMLQTSGGRSELQIRTCPVLRQGWLVSASGTLVRPGSAPHPLLAGSAERLARQGAWTRLRVERLEVLERPATPIADLRRGIAERFIAAAGAERGGMLAALVIGSAVVPLPAALREAFRASGLSHALAASGFHLTVLLGAVLVIGRPLPRAARLALAAGAILLFLLLAGPQPSVVRAVLMGATALLALESGWRTRPLSVLGLSVAVMLLARPHWFWDVGFQLSVTATAGLLVSAGPLEQALLSWMGGTRWLAASLAVPLAATLWTLPVQLLHFGVLPLYAVPANVAAAPLLTPLTLGAMLLALVVLPAPALLPVLLPPVDGMARLLLLVAHGFSALPMAQWQTGRPQPLLVVGLVLALLGVVLPRLARHWRLVAAALFALVVAVHLGLLSAEELLLVHEHGNDLLLARHRGRGALISSSSEGPGCHRARQLATGLGLRGYDWILLLDPVAPADPTCWSRQTGLLVAEAEDGRPLLAGQRLSSAGLAVEALSTDSHALMLRLGRQEWLLLPDRQALWAWRNQAVSPPERLWLGFQPKPQEQRTLLEQAPRRVWLSGGVPPRRPLPKGWSASGASGSLHSGDG